INKLSKILFEIHNGDRRFTFISPQPIKDLPLEADQMAIIATPQHIQFVAKFSEESWSTYTFIG
ncbi:MAG: hypothetical protein OXD32_05715, partial [Endozoicomonadaceae bacterium]|nr:hypothetical protein [Endozoicomonadaceae bacterium]